MNHFQGTLYFPDHLLTGSSNSVRDGMKFAPCFAWSSNVTNSDTNNQVTTICAWLHPPMQVHPLLLRPPWRAMLIWLQNISQFHPEERLCWGKLTWSFDQPCQQLKKNQQPPLMQIKQGLIVAVITFLPRARAQINLHSSSRRDSPRRVRKLSRGGRRSDGAVVGSARGQNRWFHYQAGPLISWV